MQIAQGCYLEADQQRFEPVTFWIASEHFTATPHRPQCIYIVYMILYMYLSYTQDRPSLCHCGAEVLALAGLTDDKST